MQSANSVIPAERSRAAPPSAGSSRVERGADCETSASATGRDEPASATGRDEPALGWQAAHDRVVRLAKAQAGLDHEQGIALVAALRAAVHRRLGFGSFHEYAERQLGYSARWVYERLRVAFALESLPQLAAALRDGSTNWSIVRELTRVATSETEKEWLEAASNKSARAVEELVSGHRIGDRPCDPADEGARRQVLRFEVSSDVAATFRDAVAHLGRHAGRRLSDEDVLLAMARAALGGPGEVGRASYQVAMTLCWRCARGFQQAAGGELEVPPEVVEMALCDAQHIGEVGSPVACAHAPAGAGARAVVDAAETNASAGAGTGLSASAAGNAHACAEARTGAGAEKTNGHVGSGAGASVGAATIDAHVGPGRSTASEGRATPGGATQRVRQRATQSVPPATRRLVWRRDRGGCVVPGCHNCRFCDLHHLTPRAEGGQHDPDELVVLCGAHHRAVHDGRLIIEGRVSTGLAFLHADGTRYGAPPSPRASAIFAKVFKALCHMGYKHSEATRALDGVRARLGTVAGVTDQRVLREALVLLAA